MKIYGYMRVSTDTQTVENQLLTLHRYADANNFHLDTVIGAGAISTRKSRKDRKIDETLEVLEDGDILLVSALDRIGRSTLETLQIIDELKNKGVKLHIIKQKIVVDKHDSSPMNEMMLTMLSAFAQLERDFISERTKAGLQRVKESGVKLGRKPGQVVASIYDKDKELIKGYIEMGVSIRKVSDRLSYGTPPSLATFVKKNKFTQK